MSQRLEKIPIKKQEHILQAALSEFADKGYKRASTNAIVKQADIPKGTLFYYFGSKKKLFFYILDRAIEEYVSYVKVTTQETPTDLFERLLYRAEIKLRFAREQPLLFRFFSKVFLDIPDEIQLEVMQRFSTYTEASAQDLTEGLDRSRFKEDVDVQEAINLIHLLLEGLLSRYAQQLARTQAGDLDLLIQKILIECRVYFQMVRSGIYR